MNNIIVSEINIDDLESVFSNSSADDLPIPLSPPKLTRQRGTYKGVPNSVGSDDDEVDLESFLKGITIKTRSPTKGAKLRTLKNYIPKNELEKQMKNLMSVFGSDINNNIKYYEERRRRQGGLNEQDKEDLINIHNNLRQRTIQQIDNLLNQDVEMSKEFYDYMDAFFQRQLRRIETIL